MLFSQCLEMEIPESADVGKLQDERQSGLDGESFAIPDEFDDVLCTDQKVQRRITST